MTDKKDNKNQQQEGLNQEQMDQLFENVLLNFPFANYAKIVSNLMQAFDDPEARTEFREMLEKELRDKNG